MTDSRCAECPVLESLRQQYESEYERKVSEMRRIIDQARQQMEAMHRDNQKLQEKIKELKDDITP